MAMIDLRPAHAKSRPPSGGERWLNCHASVTVVPLYPNSSSTASLKGEEAHELIEHGIIFGLRPDTHDPDIDMNVMDVLEWVKERKKAYGGDLCEVYAEQRFDIPETGEFGTCDITFITPTFIHLADYKNGFVMTEAYEQMMLYLLGAVAKYGEHEHYSITVIQPNHNHRDGPYRTKEITNAELQAFRQRTLEAVAGNTFKAGAWCKKTYCPHRGACKTFLEWCETEGEDAWYPHEVNAIDDDKLSQALDHADTLHGTRDELRKEAMRRIMNHGKEIRGYKVVKGRTQRDFAGEEGRAACYNAILQLGGYTVDDLCERKAITYGSITLYETTPLSVPGVEKLVKQKYKHFKAGSWKKVWEQHFEPHIRSFSSSLTLERETDGRPAHSRGSEFGSIQPSQGFGAFPPLSLGTQVV